MSIKKFPFLAACRCEKTEYTPIWLMRQAGRYMKEYREIRKKYSFLTACKTPELAVEITLQPIQKINLDAAIIFADILLPLEGMGIEIFFPENKSPEIKKRVKNLEDIKNLKIFEPEDDLHFTIEAIKILKRELSGKLPIIGFSGAPFTLVSYLVEGGHSRNYINTKSLMYNDRRAWDMLLDKVSQVIIKYLNAQINAGVQVVQIFDSWVGCLCKHDYKEFVLPFSKKVIQNLKPNVPVIHFGVNNSTLLELMREAGGDVIGVDWRIDLNEAWRRIGFDRAIQGNMDPAKLFAPVSVIEKNVEKILKAAYGRTGHIFNLGHGILPETPLDHVIALVDAVHNLSQK
ncbi:MAG: uroporphyrinogen decarboxylase [Thermodesulfobacteriota bacterium]|nr:uroporphyrinogen decarboxylase [Thermodesulfobacteriota bacterium]